MIRLVNSDAMRIPLPDESVQCVVTSPLDQPVLRGIMPLSTINERAFCVHTLWPKGRCFCGITKAHSARVDGRHTGAAAFELWYGGTMVKSDCKWCENEIVRRGSRPGVFCGLDCKAAWQRTQKPVDKEWLRGKYIDEGLSTYQIADIVDRDPKSILRWLKGYGIATRKSGGWTGEHWHKRKSYWNREWLFNEYRLRGRSASEIADDFGVTESAILYWMNKLSIPTRTVSEARQIKHWGASGEDNPMYGVRGEDHPGWKGGVTPERQAFYSTEKWHKASRAVRKRDQCCCRRCGQREPRAIHTAFHIHHIASFADFEELKADPDNLVLLCPDCHHWVHSNDNEAGEYLKGGD